MTATALAFFLQIPFLGLGGGDDPVPRFPAEATGDIHFQLDAARFLEDSVLVHEVYLSIPQEELFAVAAESGDSVQNVELRMDFIGHDGEAFLGRSGHLEFPVLEKDGSAGLPPSHTVTLRPEIPPETAVLGTKVTDPNASKRGLLYAIRGTKKSGEARGWFAQTPVPARGGMSDILFVWSIASPGEEGEDGGAGADLSESGRALRERILPNPAHFYGLYHRDLSFYIELYPGRDEAGSGAELIYEVTRIQDSTVVRRSAETVELLGGVVPVFRRFDVEDLEGGTYRLSVAWAGPGEEGAVAARSGPFHVLWESSTWYLTEKELLEDASILFSDERYRDFLLLDRGNRELYLERFWRQHDPSPESQENERRTEFEERKGFAQKYFGGYRKGKLSDRGRVYIRFGEPDEITKELNPQDEAVLGNVIPRELTEEEREGGLPRVFSSSDNRAYEIWYYHLRGDPLIPEFVDQTVPQQIKFIFVDQLGYGEYTLLYTNVFGGYR